MKSIDAQKLRDLDAGRVRRAATPERLLSVGCHFPPGSLTYSEQEWSAIGDGVGALIRPLAGFYLRSIRCLCYVPIGGVKTVRFDVGIYIVNPTNWQIRTADALALPAQLNAALIAPLREFSIVQGAAEAYQFVEILYDQSIHLLEGQFYAVMIMPHVPDTHYIWAPNSADTAFTVDGGDPREHIQLLAATSAAPAIELRNELATRVFTGGRSFTRF